MSHLPVDPEKMRHLEHMAHMLFDSLDEITHGDLSARRVGLAIFLFGFSSGELTYICNAERGDMIKMLLEFCTANSPEKTWDEQHG